VCAVATCALCLHDRCPWPIADLQQLKQLSQHGWSPSLLGELTSIMFTLCSDAERWSMKCQTVGACLLLLDLCSSSSTRRGRFAQHVCTYAQLQEALHTGPDLAAGCQIPFIHLPAPCLFMGFCWSELGQDVTTQLCDCRCSRSKKKLVVSQSAHKPVRAKATVLSAPAHTAWDKLQVAVHVGTCCTCMAGG
jgi:hypothetical protein